MSYPDEWVVCPDDHHKRIIRHQMPEFFPASDMVTYWDKVTNIVHVNTSLFMQLPPYDQSRLKRTRNEFEYVSINKPVLA